MADLIRVMIASDGTHAHLYQRMAWANAFALCSCEVYVWDIKKVSAFDAFDAFEPDIFMGQSYNLDEATIQCIKERPAMKVALRAGDWGDHGKIVDSSKFNIMFSTKQEIENLKRLKDETGQPEFVHIHYHPEAVQWTHNYFESIGIKPVSLMMCADTTVYSGGTFDPALECDLGFVGGYWPYKGQVIDEYLTPILASNKYRAKIFGNQPWRHINQYCGLISNENVKNLFASAKICPNLSEPHAQEFGFDVNERIFKILYAGGFCISDNVEGYNIVFGDSVPLADNADHFAELIETYIDDPEGRNELAKKGREHVMHNHTGIHRASQILKEFGYEKESKEVIAEYDRFLFEQWYGI